MADDWLIIQINQLKKCPVPLPSAKKIIVKWFIPRFSRYVYPSANSFFWEFEKNIHFCWKLKTTSAIQFIFQI